MIFLFLIEGGPKVKGHVRIDCPLQVLYDSEYFTGKAVHLCP
jgi:hypothetical protein